MNWLDEYIAENETGYYRSDDGGYWVLWGESSIRFAFGSEEEDSSPVREITRSEFIEKLIGGDSE